ncbi:MAG: phosphoenolpyruvate carboxykinase (ATP), partial [Chitinophagaceae bacterium]
EVHYQLSPQKLINQAVEKGEGVLSDMGALVIDTGEFTGRSPKDRFIVKDEITAATVDWNGFNQPISKHYYDGLLEKVMEYMKERKLWVRDCYVCAQPRYRLNVRVVNENPCCNLFAYNMFLRPRAAELAALPIDWHLIQLPRFFAEPATDGVPKKNFVIINFTEKVILIGGTQYTGEIKKAVFTILNFILPAEGVLSMHCAANVGKNGDTALFFGLSGTGKTTLSADPERKLIGDDEHGWGNDSIFNFEGGCYAKTIHLSAEKEPDIYKAIKFGAIVENVAFVERTNTVDYDSAALTENTRASYPINYIRNAVVPSVSEAPENIFFLTADAYGVLPPISRLSPEQAMYHFISGYTAKIAGTETGVLTPKPTFSACFGGPFIPLAAATYAELLGRKMAKGGVKAWLINTGWSGGGYGTGERILLAYTRAMISAALAGELDEVSYRKDPFFGLQVPSCCPDVPTALLDPQGTWTDKESYHEAANTLCKYFIDNFKKYSGSVSPAVLEASPAILRG